MERRDKVLIHATAMLLPCLGCEMNGEEGQGCYCYCHATAPAVHRERKRERGCSSPAVAVPASAPVHVSSRSSVLDRSQTTAKVLTAPLAADKVEVHATRATISALSYVLTDRRLPGLKPYQPYLVRDAGGGGHVLGPKGVCVCVRACVRMCACVRVCVHACLEGG